MNKAIGLIAGIVGVYLGIWKLLIKTIIDVCVMFDAGTLTGATIGWSILKCLLAYPVTCIVFTIVAVVLMIIYLAIKGEL